MAALITENKKLINYDYCKVNIDIYIINVLSKLLR